MGHPRQSRPDSGRVWCLVFVVLGFGFGGDGVLVFGVLGFEARGVGSRVEDVRLGCRVPLARTAQAMNLLGHSHLTGVPHL